MSTLKTHEKVIFEKLFDRGGYVLNFTDRTYAEFFREHNVNIDADKYQVNGASKMKRLRAFWEIEPDILVGKILTALLEYANAIEQVATSDRDKAWMVITVWKVNHLVLEQLLRKRIFLNRNSLN